MEPKLLLLKASKVGDLRVIKYNVEKGVKIPYNAIEKASGKGHYDIVKYLVEHGGEIMAALWNASSNGHLHRRCATVT